MKHTDLGLAGEVYAKRRFRRGGFSVVHQPVGHHYDLLISKQTEQFFVEVKTAKPDYRGYYQFSLYRKGHSNHRIKSTHILLLCLLPDGSYYPFMLPTKVVLRVNKITITHPKKYEGKYLLYKNIFSPLDCP